VLQHINLVVSRSRWLRDLRRGSVAERFLGLRVRIPPGHGCLSVVLYRWRSLRRADHSCREVLPSAVCLSVIVKPR
jgi:hypothetical protein